MKDSMGYPLPEKLLIQFANSIFLPLKKHLSVTCMFCAGGGKRTIIKLLIKEKTILKSIFEEQFDKTLFIYVDSDEMLEQSNTHYIQLILDSLKREMYRRDLPIRDTKFENPLTFIKTNLKKLTDEGWAVIFILNDFELTLSLSSNVYLNLESIMSVNKSKITYLFLSTVNILRSEVLEKIHNLKYGVTQKIVYFPLFSKDDALYIVKKNAEALNIHFSSKLGEVLFSLCGGHPQLLKYSINILHEHFQKKPLDDETIKEYLLSHYQLQIVCADIWSYLAAEEQETLSHVVLTGKTGSVHKNATEYLINLGLIKEVHSEKYRVFGKLFEEFVKKKLPPQKLVYDLKTNKLYYGSQSCESRFTFQEYKLLCYFITHATELISRDQVGAVLWGRNYVEKYSDWSIDKIISNLRKKLDALGFPSQNLSTLKKRGFSFNNF